MPYADSPAAVAPPDGPLQISSMGVDEPRLDFSLVIPTYNEGKTVARLVSQLTAHLDTAIPHRYELIVVDDNSPDRTWAVAQQLAQDYPQLRVMHRQQERGLSTAVIRGWQVARGDILGVIDADLQHPPDTLIQLLEAMQRGADLAVASRHVAGGGVSDWSVVRRFLSRGAQVLGLLILPTVVGRVTDPMSGYFMVQRRAIAGPRLSPVGYKILLEVIGRGRIDTIAEVGYVFQERSVGESKVTWKQYVAYVGHLTKLRMRGRIGPVRQRFPKKFLQAFPTRRFLRFGVVGFSGVIVDMAMLYLLSDPSTLAWGLTRSKVLAAEVAILNNFLWNDAWTFADIARSQRGVRARALRFLKFNAVCLGGLLLNVVLLNILFNGVFDGQHRYLANLIAIALVTVWNFWLNLKLSWRVTSVESNADRKPPPHS